MRERIILDQGSVKRNSDLYHVIFDDIKDQSVFLSQNYPLFEKWLNEKVIPNIINGERSIVVEKRYGNLVAFMILKHTKQEKKICTLRVMPEYEHSGLGINLFKLGFEILGTEKPLLSISDNMKSKFEKVFDYFGFKKERSYYGLYLPFREEISFNGLLNEEFSNSLNGTYNFSSINYLMKQNSHQKRLKVFSYESSPYLKNTPELVEMDYLLKQTSMVESSEEYSKLVRFNNETMHEGLLRPSSCTRVLQERWHLC